MNRIYKPGSSDMDYLLDDATAKQYLFALFKLFKSGTLDDCFAKPIEALHLDDSFENVINQYLSQKYLRTSIVIAQPDRAPLFSKIPSNEAPFLTTQFVLFLRK